MDKICARANRQSLLPLKTDLDKNKGALVRVTADGTLEHPPSLKNRTWHRRRRFTVRRCLCVTLPDMLFRQEELNLHPQLCSLPASGASLRSAQWEHARERSPPLWLFRLGCGPSSRRQPASAVHVNSSPAPTAGLNAPVGGQRSGANLAAQRLACRVKPVVHQQLQN